jgi:hypothetical protein
LFAKLGYYTLEEMNCADINDHKISLYQKADCSIFLKSFCYFSHVLFLADAENFKECDNWNDVGDDVEEKYKNTVCPMFVNTAIVLVVVSKIE